MPQKSPAAVLDEVDRYIEENRYARHSFVATLESGDYKLSGLRKWAVQKYFQTREQNSVYGAVHYNARKMLDIRKYEVGQLIDEETSSGEGSEPHYLLIKRLSDELGTPAEEYQDANMSPAVDRFVTYLLSLAYTSHPVIGMLGSYINERQTPESARRMYNALKSRHGYSDHVLEWFTVHAEADIDHADDARGLMLRHAGGVPDFEAAVWRVVRNGIEEWRALQDYYYDVLISG